MIKKKKINRFVTHNKYYLFLCVLSLSVVMVFVSLLLLDYSNNSNTPLDINSFIKYINVYTFISTVAGIIGVVMAFFELHGSRRLNEASYIKDLNQQFINNKEMVDVEHALETYNNKHLLGETHDSLELDIRVDGKDRQKLVNYLVYLEGISSIIEQGVLHIDEINSLFGYRYFLAVNNPVVQNIELYPFANYYQGIFNVYDKWIKKCKNKNSDLFMNIPIYDHKLNTNIQLAHNERIRKANKEDDFKVIANLLYQTDSKIYTALLNNKETIDRLAELIKLDTGFFSYKNLLVLVKKEKINGEYIESIKAVLLYNNGEKEFLWNEKNIANVLKNNSPSFYDVSKKYFSKYSKKNKDTINIVALVVDKRYRYNSSNTHYYGFFLLNQLSSLFCDKTLSLEVLENNDHAIHLYKKYLLFEINDKYPGYAYKEKPTDALKMLRYPLCRVKTYKTTDN